MTESYLVYGAVGSGSVPIEAALTLAGAPYSLFDGGGWQELTASAEMARINPMRQVPALVLPAKDGKPGELMTESAAIMLWLGDAYPDSGLAPALGSPMRPRYLRWMSFISAQVYALYWIRDRPSRLVDGEAAEALVKARTAARIADCWRIMGEQVRPEGRFLLGDEISALDLYLTVISRWGPRRKAFYAAAPGLADVVRAADADPRLAALWAERFPFVDGWEG